MDDAYRQAIALWEAGRLDAAQAKARALVKRFPDEPAFCHLLGQILLAAGEGGKAVYHLRRSLALGARTIEGHLDLIRALGESQQPEGAVAVAREADAAFPGHPQIATQLGFALIMTGRPADARRAFARAVAIDPTFVFALHNLARLTDEEGDRADALQLYRRACACDPGFQPAALNLADLAMRLGLVEEAISTLDRLLAQQPADANALSARCYAEQYRPGVTAADLARLHARWERHVGAALRPPQTVHQVIADPDRSLRIGLVSADLRNHPVGYFTIGALEHTDTAAATFIAYAGVSSDDAVAQRFRQRVTTWHQTQGWSDERLAQQIVRDRIDILIDLSGHTRDTRIACFARCPAPIQLTWAAYVGTTGLRAMDGVIADRYQIPPGEEPQYVERVLRLPESYICFDPPDFAPDVASLPAGLDRPLRFAAFHNPAKINPDVVRLWARVLLSQPEASIAFVYAGYEVPDVQSRIRGWFAEAQIRPDRLDFSGAVPRAQLLARYGETDIALDPFPYSGGLTTLEALWMGVPVVTWPGATFGGRHSLSHLTIAGLPEMVAQSSDDYLTIVDRLGRDREALAALRAGLRARLLESPLLDPQRFAVNLHSAIRSMWREWCAARPSA